MKRSILLTVAVMLFAFLLLSALRHADPGARPGVAPGRPAAQASEVRSGARLERLNEVEAVRRSIEAGAIDAFDAAARALPRRSLSGTVETPAGAPAVGARVSLHLELPGGAPAAWSRAIVDDSGRFALELPRDFDGPLQLLARSPDLGPALVELDRVPVHEPRLTLSEGHVLRGHIRSGDGLALGGARVRLEVAPGSFAPWHRADELDARAADASPDGEFVLSGVPAGRVSILASAEGHADRVVELAIGDSTGPLELVLDPERVLVGAVVDDAGGPVARAEIEVRPRPDAPLGRREIRADESGRFRVGGLSAGTHVVLARPATHGTSLAPARVDVELPQAGELRIVLRAGGAVSGRVQRPVPGPYWVRLSTAKGERVVSEQSETAEFSVDGVPAGDYLLALATEGGVEQPAGEVRVASGAITDVGLLALAVGSRITGLVFPESGTEAVAAGCTLLSAPRSGAERRVIAVTDTRRDGSFSFEGIPAGRYTAFLTPDVGHQVETAPFEVDGASPVDLGAILLARGGTVEVVVHDAPNRPRAGASLSLQTDDGAINIGTTDAMGRARFEDVVPGPFTVHVSLDGALRSELGYAEAGVTTEVRLELWGSALAAWEGVLERGSGSVAAGLGIVVSALDGSWRSAASETAPDGSFRLEGVGAGHAVLDIYGVESPTHPVHVLVELHSAGAGPGVVRLPSGTIAGRATPGALVTLGLQGGGWAKGSALARQLRTRFATKTCDDEGHFEFGHLPSGRFEVRAHALDAAAVPAPQVVELGEGARAAIEVALR